MNEKEFERMFKALANRRRIAILFFLKKEGEATVGEISRAIRLSFAATSRHLGVLSGVDFLEKDQRSLSVFYRIAEKSKERILFSIQKIF